MPDLLRPCGVENCEALVDANTVSEHMDGHGLLLPQDWNLATWPDGYPVLIDPSVASTEAKDG